MLEYAQLLSLSSTESMFPVGGSLVVRSLSGLYEEIFVDLHLVQGLNQLDLPAYLLEEIHHLATVGATFPIKFINQI